MIRGSGVLLCALLWAAVAQDLFIDRAQSKQSDFDVFKLRLLEDSTSARCLDGSSPGYYIRRGSGVAGANFKVHLSGGGWCFDEEGCRDRANKTLGSSTFWPPVANTDQEHFPGQWNIGLTGLLGNDSANELQNWTSIFIMSCDGSSFTSYREEPVGTDSPLYFRGRAILDEVIADLLDQGMADAPAVIVSGTSAGGLATYAHAQLFRERLPSPAQLYAVPDAGFWPDHPNVLGVMQIRDGFREGVDLWNTSTVGPNQLCLDHYGPKEAWRCYFAQYLLPFIAVPTFVVQSLYDPTHYALVLALGCSDLTKCDSEQQRLAEKYREDLQAAIVEAVGQDPRRGLFATACNQHEETCRQSDWEGIVVQSSTMGASLGRWLDSQQSGGGSVAQVDIDVAWPGNPSCQDIFHGAC